MRIALLGLYPAQPDRILGGVEAVVAMLADELARDPDLELHVVTLREKGEAVLTTRPTPHAGKPAVHRLTEPRFGRLTWHLTETRRLRQALETLRPDLVHAHGSLVYAAAALRSGFPAVVTVHGIMAREVRTVLVVRKRLARVLDAWYERYSLRSARHLIAISPYVLEAYPWLRPEHIYHIENPVDNRFFAVERQEDPLRLLCVARVIPRKGLLFALQALAILRREMPEIELRVAGETLAMPTYYQACQSFISEQGLQDHVRFLDNLSLAQLTQEYSRCALMLLPSMQETAPVSIGEAMAAAVPVVATRVGGVPHMVLDGVTGRLVDYGDAAGLVATLQHVLSHAPLRRAMGHEARSRANQRFRLATVAARTKKVYRGIVEQEAQKAQ